jgi:hypothetical protein
MKVGQSLMVKRQLVTEKGLKEKMIHSVMPPKVAVELMKNHDIGDGDSDSDRGGRSDKKRNHKGYKKDNEWSSDDEDYDNQSESASMVRKVSSPRSSDVTRWSFRPFNMSAMDNVR